MTLIRAELKSAALRTIYHIVMALSVTIPVSAHADTVLSSDALYGTVVAIDSAFPVEGVYVSVRWSAEFPSLGEGRDRCVKATAVKTDKDGRFRIPAWNKTLGASVADLWVDLEPYSPGYQDALHPNVRLIGRSNLFNSHVDIHAQKIVLKITPAEGTPETRREYLDGVISRSICEMPDTAGVQQLYEAMLPEAKTLPPKKDQGSLELTPAQRLEYFLPPAPKATKSAESRSVR